MEMQIKMEMEKLKAELQSKLQKEKYEFELQLAGIKEDSAVERNLMDNLPTKEVFTEGVRMAQAEQEPAPGGMPN